MIPTLPLASGSERRNCTAPSTSPTRRSSGTPPAARTAAEASSGLAPGASRQCRLGMIAVYPLAANRRAFVASAV